MTSDEINSHTIIAIITGILLSISEMLPFISKIESKGLLHFLVNQGNQLLKKADSDETQPLLPVYNRESAQSHGTRTQSPEQEPQEQQESQEHQEHQEHKQRKKQLKSDTDHDTDNQSNTLHKILKRKRKTKGTEGIAGESKTKEPCLKTSEEYELDFLKNYITTRYLDHIVILPTLHSCNKELFEKMGYKIFYDHIDDKYTLKW